MHATTAEQRTMKMFQKTLSLPIVLVRDIEYVVTNVAIAMGANNVKYMKMEPAS